MPQAPRDGDPGASSEAETRTPSQRKSPSLGQDTKAYADTHTGVHPTSAAGAALQGPLWMPGATER